MMGDNFDMLRRALDLPTDADVEKVCGLALERINSAQEQQESVEALEERLQEYSNFVWAIRDLLDGGPQ